MNAAFKQTEMGSRNGARRLLYSQKSAPYVFVMPFLLIFAIFFAYPVVMTFVMSMQSILPGQVKFIGVENFQKIWSDPTFYKAVSNSVTYTLFTLALLIPFPLVFAVMLDSKRMIARDFFRGALFVPALTSVVVAGVIFKLMFAETGDAFFNSLIGLLGFEPVKWLKRADTGMFALVVVACWRWTGVNVLYFIAGLQNIPGEIYESVEIDGASVWQRFIHITVPLLRPTTIYVLTISIYGSMAMFTESYMLHGGNKSIANIGLTIVGYLYRKGIEQNFMGYGTAVGVCLLIFVFIVNMMQLKLFGLFKREADK